MTAPDLARPWYTDAECVKHDADLWDDPDARGTALHICREHCPVLAQCRAWARAEHQRSTSYHPVWSQTVVGGEYWTTSSGGRPSRPTTQDLPTDIRHCRTCRGPDACGTVQAWRRHRDRGEQPDGPCRRAYRAWDRQRGRVRRASTAPSTPVETRHG